MKMKYIFTGLLNREHVAFKKSDADIRPYGLIAGKIYTIEGTPGMRYIIRNHYHPHINEQLVNIYFKPLQEVRDTKLEQLINENYG